MVVLLTIPQYLQLKQLFLQGSELNYYPLLTSQKLQACKQRLAFLISSITWPHWVLLCFGLLMAVITFQWVTLHYHLCRTYLLSQNDSTLGSQSFNRIYRAGELNILAKSSNDHSFRIPHHHPQTCSSRTFKDGSIEINLAKTCTRWRPLLPYAHHTRPSWAILDIPKFL